METRSRSKSSWRKILYEKQNFPDDYQSNDFLKDLKKNVRYYSLFEIYVAASRLSQEISVIVLFISVFLALQTESSRSPSELFLGIPSVYTIVTFVSMTLYLWLYWLSKKDELGSQHKSAIIFLVSGFAVSPVLKTLTETISTDTIWLMVILMMAMHLVFYDYGVQCAIVSTPISLNAGIFGAVCLASRLKTTLQAFTLLIWASDVFVLFTGLRNKFRDKLSLFEQSLFSLAIVSISLASVTFVLNWVFALMYLILLVAINFVIPFGFYKLQPLKETFIAPWDEAVIQTNAKNYRHYVISSYSSNN